MPFDNPMPKARKPSRNPCARERRATRKLGSHDFFPTPPEAIQALLDRECFPAHIWEPAAGDGSLARVLSANGYTVTSTDLVGRGECPGGTDFLEMRVLPPGVQAIVTNPPFRLATEFALHSLALGARKVALFGRLGFLAGQRRKDELFGHHLLARCWIFSRRLTLWRGDDPGKRDTGGAIDFAWFVFEPRPNHGAATIGWI